MRRPRVGPGSPSLVTSPKPEETGSGLEKNWRVKVLLGIELKLPCMVVEAPKVTAEEITGKFWRLLGPISPSPPYYPRSPGRSSGAIRGAVEQVARATPA